MLLSLTAFARGQTLEDAVRALAKTVAAGLSPGEVAHVTPRSLSPSLAAESARAGALLDRALRRPAARGATAVEVVVTAAENLRGPLLVVEIQRSPETIVETAAYTSPPAIPASRPSLAARVLWEQDDPILDVAAASDGLLVLTPSGSKLCGRDGCEARDARPLSVRDPRGRLGTASGEFEIDRERVHFSPGQNTLETADREKFYSVARAGPWRLTAGLDGRIHASQGQQTLAWDGWGSDIVAVPCGSSALVVATAASGPDSADSVTAYEIAAPAPRAVTDPLPLPGPVTALWPAPGGALAVVRQLATGRYVAYTLALDCGR